MNRLLIGAFLALVLGCSKTNNIPQSPVPTPVTPPVTVNDRISGTRTETDLKDRPYTLNVVYFVPKDLDTIRGYLNRLDDMMLWGQDWFHDKMKIYGYDKTFGMYTDQQKKRIRITTIYGTKTASQYTSEGGAKPIWDEIEAYFKAHPQEKGSDHYLNIVPRYSFKPSGEPTGPPYHGATYGKNRTCFVLDYEDMDMRYMDDKTDKGKWFRIYYGGLLHELGHALNLPHNMQTVTELHDPMKGTAMMHAGNYSLGVKPTFLTPSDCEMLAVNPLFNTVQREYYGKVNAKVLRMHGAYVEQKSAIVISGKFSTDVPVSGIAVYNDPNVNNEGVGTNKDYNAVSFATKPIAQDSFYLEMPVTDFTYRSQEEYELKVFLIHNNGTFSTAYYSYRFVNNMPVINFGTRKELSKGGWSVAGFSSEETAAEGRASSLIDGHTSTFWHSRWSSNAASYPHFVTIDLGTVVKPKGLVYWQREGASRAVKEFELLVSEDGINFVSLGVKKAANSSGPQYFDFDSERAIRFFKLQLKSSWDGTPNAAIAELGLY